MVFDMAVSSPSSSTACIVLKGPTGSGKSFLFDKLIEKFEKFVRISDIDNLPTSINEEQLKNLNGNSIFHLYHFQL